jgi:hypothetical protein
LGGAEASLGKCEMSVRFHLVAGRVSGKGRDAGLFMGR